MVLQCPRLGFVAETGRIVAMDALSTIFLLLCLASYFSYFLLPYPGLCLFVVFLCLCRSQLLISASTYFIVRVLFCMSFVSFLISEFLCFYSFSVFSHVVLVSRAAFLCSALDPGTLAFAYLDSSTILVFLCLTVCDHIICICVG